MNELSRVTMADIAEAAGVSVPTVSRVLNGRRDVSKTTRERVEALLEEHGYRRRAARRRGSPHLIDLVFPDLDSPWAVEIIRGVDDVVLSAGIATVVTQIHRTQTSVQMWWDNLQERSTDGVILVTSELDEELQAELDRREIPVVVVDPAGTTAQTRPTVGATNWSGGMAATEHLLSLGHRRIALITGAMRVLCSLARLNGYRAALDNAGVTYDEDLVIYGDFYHEAGFTGTQKLLELDEPPTAIFACSDQMALGAYEAVRQRGLRVPEDVSVVGFDDLPQARWASPPLTTVRQPLAQMGMVAARTLLRLIAEEPLDSPRLEVATDLVVRESTAPAPSRR
ncbi:MAG: LacI family DNA-binding transcriptional regulator [Kineosporiaceae bacterium]